MSASKWKPYPNYQSTEIPWIREIPIDWEIKRVKHVSYCLDSLRVPLNGEERGKIQGKYPYYGATKQVDSISEYIFDEHLVLLGEDGAPFFDPLKDVAYEISGKTWVNNHAHVLRAVGIDPTFLTHALNIVGYEHYINGSTRDKLNQQQMNEITIPYPTEKDSEIIGKWLKKFDYQIEIISLQLEKLLGILVEKRTTLITQAVTIGLNPNVSFKNIQSEWIESIPESWSNLRMKQIVSTKVTDGPHVTPVQVDEGVPFLSATAVENGRLNMNKMWGYISREDHELYCRKCLPQLEDIFMVKSGATTGSIAFVDFEDEFSVWSPLALIRCDKNKMHPKFVFYSLQSDYLQKAISQTWSKGTQENIAMKAIEELPIMKPPLSEQIEIANHIDASIELFVELVSKTNSMIEMLREYRMALISAAVTGKIDLRGWTGTGDDA